MLTIQFDTEAAKTKAIEGPFSSREEIEAACIKSSPDDAAYNSWAVKHDVDPQSGSIVTSAYNPDLLERRYSTLAAQLDDFIAARRGAAPASGLSYRVPANLLSALDLAARENPALPLKALMISTTRETLHFDLREKFPQLQTVIAAPTKDFADRCNDLIAEKAPELTRELSYRSDWRNVPVFDVVAVNPAIHYLDQQGLKDLVRQIADAGPESVVFSNLMPNDDVNGAEQWKTQRYSGGVIPLFIPAKGALTALMNEAGYTLERETKAPVGFDLAKGNSFAAQNPVLENYTYTLAHRLP